MLSFEFDGRAVELESFIDGLETFTPGASLGGVESLVEVLSLMVSEEGSHGSATADVPETLVRLSVGIEHVDDLCEDVRTALPVPFFPAISIRKRECEAVPNERVWIIRAAR